MSEKYMSVMNMGNRSDLTLVRDNKTGKLFVSRVINDSQLQMYRALQSIHCQNIPQIIEILNCDNETYKVIEEYEDTSLIEVELVTGKTHQIRAHLAHIGHFVIGDQKYGDSKVNQKFKKKYQCLTAYKIKFHFDKNSVLSYLNNKEIVLPKEKLKILSKNK